MLKKKTAIAKRKKQCPRLLSLKEMVAISAVNPQVERDRGNPRKLHPN
jgi:hypothetical protein